jgi:hypothetical protein
VNVPPCLSETVHPPPFVRAPPAATKASDASTTRAVAVTATRRRGRLDFPSIPDPVFILLLLMMDAAHGGRRE